MSVRATSAGLPFSPGAVGGLSVPLFLAVLAAATLATPARALDFPRQGVVCDRERRICYDSEGPSLAQTRRAYGDRAERRLLDQLSGRPPTRHIQFSSGEVCDLRRRLCWDDGWRRSNESRRLTRQLFGTASSGDGRSCRLTRQGRTFFEGTCRLQSFGDTYVVETEGDRSYRFENRDGRLFLRDATGLWPVTVFRRVNAVLFRWADVQLAVSSGRSGFSTPGWPGPGWWNMPSQEPGSSGEDLQQLIESIFR